MAVVSQLMQTGLIASVLYPSINIHVSIIHTQSSSSVKMNCVPIIILNWASLVGSLEGHGVASSSAYFGHFLEPIALSSVNSSLPFLLHGKMVGT